MKTQQLESPSFEKMLIIVGLRKLKRVFIRKNVVLKRTTTHYSFLTKIEPQVDHQGSIPLGI